MPCWQKPPAKKSWCSATWVSWATARRVSTSASGLRSRLAGIDKIFTLGELSAHSVAAISVPVHGISKRMEELLPEVRELLAPDVTLLIKGSRFMKMERLVKSIEL